MPTLCILLIAMTGFPHLGLPGSGGGNAAGRGAPPTQLPPVIEGMFQIWYKRLAEQYGIDPNPDDPEHHYDYRAAFMAGANPIANGHWPSEFKGDAHPNRYPPEENYMDTKLGLPGGMVPDTTPQSPSVMPQSSLLSNFLRAIIQGR